MPDLRGFLRGASVVRRRRTLWRRKAVGVGTVMASLLQFALLTPPALAFPQVQITDGSITESGTAGQTITLNTLVGEGFAVTGQTAEGGLSSFVSPSQAVPNTNTTLVLQGSDQIVTSSFLINGISYLSPFALTVTGIPMIASPVAFPGASAGGLFTETFPFAFAATFRVFDNAPLIGHLEDGVDAVGSGMGEATYRSVSPIGPWELQTAQFDFDVQPVPEPSALLLLGSGLAGLGGLAWRRRSRSLPRAQRRDG